MPAKYITLNAKDGSGSYTGYLALPDSGTGPGVVVIQEIFGINTPMREICDQLANQGYMALCPDFFWRQEPGIQLNDKIQKDWDRAFELYQGFDVDKGIDDIQTALSWLRKADGSNGKAGVIGYCLGGFLAYLSACRTDADAAVGYYGVSIDSKLDEADNIKGHLLLHVATEDEFVDKAAQQAMHNALDNHPHITLHDYEGMNHAFARPGGTHYDEKAAKKANDRTLEFLKTRLG
ncbi:carboxymethylenebutenolidase [Iodidimonas muriae]|uniref:Carboxymethylenebutenolidase n=1 Tax=Iodidimonas muriae TaxID=261467 RepID=A0ABQ2LBL2_9PROT|nr:dienelactone hydrolase family protein [Iodidimonas muriae]GER05962.1 carboxymethylenebutenolidase [Kordiimonadales bacterium JCM 17843]GGO07602.1 carboxymethylenebutenolidase [Iodidimonas muriae]